MSILSELEKLHGQRILIYTSYLAGAFCPGILLIFIFLRPLFFQLDTVKLLLLATSMSLPLIMLNAFLLMLVTPRQKTKSADEHSLQLHFLVMVSSLLTTAIYLFGITLGHLKGFTATNVGITVAIIESIGSLIAIATAVGADDGEDKKLSNPPTRPQH